MKNNVVPFNSKNENKGMDQYVAPGLTERVLERAGFVTGVLATIVLPRIIYCSYGGPISANAFIGLAVLGTVIGVAMYYRPTDGTLSCVGKRTTPKLMSTEGTLTRKAA